MVTGEQKHLGHLVHGGRLGRRGGGRDHLRAVLVAVLLLLAVDGRAGRVLPRHPPLRRRAWQCQPRCDGSRRACPTSKPRYRRRERTVQTMMTPPFPADAFVQEDDAVEAGNVENGEDAEEAADDADEEELVPPRVAEPLVVPASVVAHVEEAAAHVDHLPGQNEREPGDDGKGRGTRTEDELARVSADIQKPYTVRSMSISGVKMPHLFERGFLFMMSDDAFSMPRPMAGKPEVDHDDVQNLDRRQREDREASVILEGQTDEQDRSLSDVLSKQVADKLGDVVGHAAALLDGVPDRGKVVVPRGESLTPSPVMAQNLPRRLQSLDHPDLGLRRAAGNDERKLRHRVDLGIRKLVELSGPS
ncbi:hypothetical protein L1887_59316 [Cichorium endivia]|nr:hypothetical protein L1887_59316 [Cichorium endivia]